MPVVTYFAYVLCAIIMAACMSTLGVLTLMGSKIVVRTIVGSNTTSQSLGTWCLTVFFFVGICTAFSCGAKVGDFLLNGPPCW